MSERLNLTLANALYLLPLHVRRFKATEPSAIIVAAGATKAQKRNRDTGVQFEREWIMARRGALILTTEKLVCGSWHIPLSSIKMTHLLYLQARTSRVLLLKVATTEGDHYQFGLQYDPVWETQTVLPYTTIGDGISEFVPIKLSKFSVVLRLLFLLGWLVTCFVVMNTLQSWLGVRFLW